MPRPLVIVGLVGSLRKGSYNEGLMRAAQELLPAGATLSILPIGDLPHYNKDLEQPLPGPVATLKQQIETADAVLIATPEYNYSVPGVLKNALDWISRPYGKNSMEDKPVAIMGATPGMLGTSRAQYHLRQMLVELNCHAVNRPEVMVPAAHDKFDATGRLTDDKTRAKVKELLEALIAWTERLSRA